MTLLVGIRCKDGVVVAADRAVTFGTTDGTTMIRTISHLACKISVLKGGVIVAGTGQLGAGQRFCETAERIWLKEIAGKSRSPLDACRILCTEGVQDFQATGMQSGKIGALVAFPSTKGGPQLCEFAVADFQPELKDAGTWFVSMGSGQVIADSYLAFMRDAFWRDGMPILKQAMFAAAWVMRQSIRVAPGFIAEPIDIAVLEKDKARMLETGELTYLMDAADQATKHFGTFDPSTPAALGEVKESVAPAPPIPEPPPVK